MKPLLPPSLDGKAFISGSSERWAQAAVAAGTDPDAAGAAARRTTAFYTGESAEAYLMHVSNANTALGL